jgi:transcriptional regulator
MMTERSFAEIWASLGEAVALADRIIGSDPAELTAALIKARLGDGTKTEHRVLAALDQIKGYAQVQVGLADDAIAIMETVTKHADEAALAALSAGAAN